MLTPAVNFTQHFFAQEKLCDNVGHKATNFKSDEELCLLLFLTSYRQSVFAVYLGSRVNPVKVFHVGIPVK